MAKGISRGVYPGGYTDRFPLRAVDWELHILSAHRNPEEVSRFAKDARMNGYSILIGAAGMAAHLAGVLKAHTTLPVIGIPLPGGILDGLDSLLSSYRIKSIYHIDLQ